MLQETKRRSYVCFSLFQRAQRSLLLRHDLGLRPRFSGQYVL